jgi:hypothetical protein
MFQFELTIHCLVSMQGLQFHLNSSHDLFEFEFKVCGFMEFLVLPMPLVMRL